MREIVRFGDGRVMFLRYSVKIPHIARFGGGRNRPMPDKLKPYANFDAYMGNRKLLSLTGHINNEHEWGLFYTILGRWTLGIGWSCYGHNKYSNGHCEFRGGIIPRIQRVEPYG